ncbi:Histidine kinase-, DNA gyrase B-, and HSP90-like ATPase [Rubrobacter radiotolerans DSM 5868]|nr:Histidine kinase-, DNA gyrase B-, and HSP90-like ATPase [Rubrobacter radiotolerans DSM 5868]
MLVGTVAFVLMHFGVDSVQHARRWVGLDPLQPLPGGAAEVAFAYPVPCAALFFGSLYLTFRSGSLRGRGLPLDALVLGTTSGVALQALVAVLYPPLVLSEFVAWCVSGAAGGLLGSVLVRQRRSRVQAARLVQRIVGEAIALDSPATVAAAISAHAGSPPPLRVTVCEAAGCGPDGAPPEGPDLLPWSCHSRFTPPEPVRPLNLRSLPDWKGLLEGREVVCGPGALGRGSSERAGSTGREEVLLFPLLSRREGLQGLLVVVRPVSRLGRLVRLLSGTSRLGPAERAFYREVSGVVARELDYRRLRDESHGIAERRARWRERERTRRRLHDTVVQDLGRAIQTVNALLARHHYAAENAGFSRDDLLLLERVRANSVSAHEKCRRVVDCPEEALDRDEASVEDTLREVVGEFEREHPGFSVGGGIPTSETRLSTAACSVLARTAREALTNAAKHAAARTLCLSFAADAATARLTVSDNGCGFDAGSLGRSPTRAAGSFGLASLRDDARRVGGDFSVRSEKGRGTVVEVTVPLVPSGNSTHSAEPLGEPGGLRV